MTSMPNQDYSQINQDAKSPYDQWIEKARIIFCSSFVDQLIEWNCCEIWGQLQQSLRYLHQDIDGQQLDPDADIEEWKTKLGIPPHEISRIFEKHLNQKERKYEMALAAIQKALDDFRGLGQRTFQDSQSASSLDREECDCMDKSICESVDEFHIDSYLSLDSHNLKRYERPLPSFKKSESFVELLDCVKNRENKIIHVYGMSTSGKSQSVRAVCESLDKQHKNLIIWHVQCQLQGEIIKMKWLDLVNNLEKAGLITYNERSDIVNDGEDLRMGLLIKYFRKYHVLLVVEDVSEEERDLVRNFIRAIAEPSNQNIQLITVSQKKETFFIQDDINAMDVYMLFKISGFTENEATEFLDIDGQESPFHERVALAEVLAYSPLRLLMAKRYCEKYRESYENYFSGLGIDRSIIDVEKKIMEEHPELYGLAKEHGYEVFIKMLKPQNVVERGVGENKREHNQFNVLKMMSFIDNANIPDLLIGRFFQEVEEISVGEERSEVMFLMERLESQCDASVRDVTMTHEYGKRILNIHMDILHAIRMHMSDEEKAEVLVSVFQAMISLVGKENRLRADSTLLFDMLCHMNRVTELGVQLLETQYKLEESNKENFEIQMGLSRLYEVLGFATTQHTIATKDENFEKAIDFLWRVACCYTGSSFFHLKFGRSLKKANQLQHVLHYGSDKNASQVAKDVYKTLKIASLKVPVELIERNCARFFPLNPGHLCDMKTKVRRLPQPAPVNWERLEGSLKDRRHLSDEQLNSLHKNGCVLKPKKLQSIYLTECIASILHSRGRQVLYLKDSVSSDEQKRYEWYTDVGLQLCKTMSKDTKIKSIFEYILVANNKLPRMMHAKEGERDDEFWERIENARALAIRLRDVEEDFYEHGIYKLVSGTPYTVMNAVKYLVKANTKLYKRPAVAEHHNIPTADVECEHLYQLAKDNVSIFVVAASCLVHVGKYFAATKKHCEAIEAFELTFKLTDKEQTLLDKNPNTYAWALYNTGRNILAGYGKIENGYQMKKKFMERMDTVSRCDIPKNLRILLEDIKYRLDQTDFLECSC